MTTAKRVGPSRDGKPLLSLAGVVSPEDIGEWEVFSALGKSGNQRGKPLPRERVYGLRHPKFGIRYACGPCGLIFLTVSGADGHRFKTHPRKPGQRFRPANNKPTEQSKAAMVAAMELPEPAQMTIDDIGLDLAGPALVEGVAAIVASRANARLRVRELEDEVARLKGIIATIREMTGEW